MKKPFIVVPVLGILALCLLMSACSRCSDSASKPPATPTTQAPSVTATPPSLVESAQERLESGEFRESIRLARAAFDEALAKNPKSPDTWAIYLKICEAQAKMQSPQAPGCYSRFFEETASIRMDDRVMATAIRWRLIIALEQGKAAEAARFLEKLDAVEPRLIMQGKMRRREQAYSASIRGGVLQLREDHVGAVREFQRAVALYRESAERDPLTLLDYLDKLALAHATAEQYAEALRILKEMENLVVSRRGGVHPDVAVVKLKRINVLLDMGEKLQARGEWDYVQHVIGQFRKAELPEHIDRLYVETMIRLDVDGLLGGR